MKVTLEEKVDLEKFIENYFPPTFTYFKEGYRPINEAMALEWMDSWIKIK